jgi:hypothetical protein
MKRIIFKRHDGAAQPSGGGDPVSGFELVQHALPFFLAALLGKDQEKVKNSEDKDERRDAEPSHTTATGLYRKNILHAHLRTERKYPQKMPALFVPRELLFDHGVC